MLLVIVNFAEARCFADLPTNNVTVCDVDAITVKAFEHFILTVML